MIKVRLLTDGSYSFMEGVVLPQVVEAIQETDKMVQVSYAELKRIGASDEKWEDSRLWRFAHYCDGSKEYEIIDVTQETFDSIIDEDAPEGITYNEWGSFELVKGDSTIKFEYSDSTYGRLRVTLDGVSKCLVIPQAMRMCDTAKENGYV